MADKKYQVFISSTYMDLKDERNDITRAILNLNHIPAGMELFPAIDEEQFSFIQKVIDDCDYYILIIGGRYGSLSAEGISYTEMEYDYAVEKKLKIIRLINNMTGSIPVEKSDTHPDLVKKLSEFRNKVTTGKLTKFWHDQSSLQAAFYESFSQTTSRHPAVGWVRADSISNHDLLLQLNAVRNENERLKTEIAELSIKKAVISNLASMEEIFLFKISSAQGASFGWQTVKMSWGKLFQHIAAECRGLRPRDILNEAVTRRILDEKGQYASGESKIDASSWEKMLVQLTAAGLLWTEDRKRYELTEMGLSSYTEATVVRRVASPE